MAGIDGHFDTAIIGQGLAGSLAGWYLAKAGQRILVIDDSYRGSSSVVAAGIVNPITGKSFVRSWNIGEFLPFALLAYRDMEAGLGISVVREVNIIRSLYTTEDENNWYARSADPVVGRFVSPHADISEFAGKVTPPFSYGETCGTFHVHLAILLQALKERWTESGNYMEDKFCHNELEIAAGGFKYRNLTFGRILFCEGHLASANPYFKLSAMAPSKGEVLLVKIPGASFRKMYKDDLFMVHQHDDVYWVGSGYQWNAPDDRPTEATRLKLEAKLAAILTVPFEVVGHKAAIRPTMHTRRPVFIEHDEIKGMFMFNGLGTKGTSIGPLAASQISDYLTGKEGFPPLFASLSRG